MEQKTTSTAATHYPPVDPDINLVMLRLRYGGTPILLIL